MARRPHTPLKVKLDAALIQLGLDPDTAELDHFPALERRDLDEAGNYTPPANDPRFMQWLAPSAHKVKTFGRGGEKRITTAGSDIGEITKERHLTEDHEAFRERLLRKVPGEPREKSGKIRSRGFDKRPRRFNQRRSA